MRYKGIATTEKVVNGLNVDVKGLVDSEGNKHEDLHWHVQNMRPGTWLNYKITSLEDIVEE